MSALVSTKWFEEFIETTYRPTKGGSLERYVACLHAVLDMEPVNRYENPFTRPKSNGGERVIRPAKEPLAYVQRVLAAFIATTFPPSGDFCYSVGKGTGASGTARLHIGAQGMVLLDIKSAFDQISSKQLRFRFKAVLGSTWENEMIELLIDLFTLDGHTPQGCPAVPKLFNVLFAPIDKQLALLANSYPEILRITRYSDNIGISVSKVGSVARLEKLGRQARVLIEGGGFKVGTFEVLTKPPFEFLKVLVYEDRIELADDRYEKLVALLEQALADANPGQYKDALVGKYNWAMTTFAGELPEFLEALFQKYFVAYLLYLLTKVTCSASPGQYKSRVETKYHWAKKVFKGEIPDEVLNSFREYFAIYGASGAIANELFSSRMF